MSSGLSGLLGGYGSDGSDEPRSTSTNNGESPREEEGPEPATSARADLKGATKPSSGPQSKDDDGDSDNDVDDSDSDSDSDDSDSDTGSGDIEEKGVDKGNALGRKRPNGGGDGGSGLLPSVDDLFQSTAGPDFLSVPGAGKEFAVKTLQKKKAEKSDLSSFSTTVSPATPGGSSNPDRESYKRERGMGAATAVGVKRSKSGALGPAGPPVDRKAGETDKNGKGKVTAKDRVKEQRLKGQSGIGPDFRVWKSDLEMTMRQEYD